MAIGKVSTHKRLSHKRNAFDILNVRRTRYHTYFFELKLRPIVIDLPLSEHSE